MKRYILALVFVFALVPISFPLQGCDISKIIAPDEPADVTLQRTLNSALAGIKQARSSILDLLLAGTITPGTAKALNEDLSEARTQLAQAQTLLTVGNLDGAEATLQAAELILSSVLTRIEEEKVLGSTK